MMSPPSDRAAVLTANLAGGFAGHELGDYLVQSDCDAQKKQERTRAGRIALARHAVTYAASQGLVRTGLCRAAGLRVPCVAQLAGAAVEGGLHAAIDDGRLLARFADLTGKRRFHDLAGNGINGRALLDQAAHKSLQIPVGAVVTTAITALLRTNPRQVR